MDADCTPDISDELRTTVHNLRVEEMRPGDVYCGRAGHGHDGYFGNPYGVKRYGAEAIPRYSAYLLDRLCEDGAFRVRVAALHGSRLFCFCSSASEPAPCHVHLLAEAADWLATHDFAAHGAECSMGALRRLLDAVLRIYQPYAQRYNPHIPVLRVVTLWRPWDFAITQLVADVAKRVENRGRAAPYRCPWYMAVRGGQTWDDVWESWVPLETDWPAGYVTGVAEVVAHDAPGTGPESTWRNPEAWGWRLGRVAALPSPVQWPPPKESRHPGDRRSMQGFVELKPELYEYDGALLSALRLAWAAKYGRGE